MAKKEKEIPLAAPGLIGPASIVDQPIQGPRSARRSRNRPYSHVHLEVDLKPDADESHRTIGTDSLAALVGERKIVEPGTLVVLAVHTLHALAARRLRWIVHWEISPGGWLPPPTQGAAPEGEEPVGHLIDALESDSGQAVRLARSFSARLTDQAGAQVDLTVRRVHRERRHAISLDLWGKWTPESVKVLQASLSSRLPVERSTMTKYQYRDG